MLKNVTQPQAHAILYSKVLKSEKIKGFYEQLVRKGSRYYLHDGSVLKIPKNVDYSRISYMTLDDHGHYQGEIIDKVLVSRIMEYFAHYWGKKNTNCATFANFLTTGSFIECTERENYAVIEQGMNAYTDQKVRIGDMVCVMYAHDHAWNTRKGFFRSKYRKIKKSIHESGNTIFSDNISPIRNTLPAERIAYLLKGGNQPIHDYHFYVCVDIDNSEPVWISQVGKCFVHEAKTPIVITKGACDTYYHDGHLPILTLIKRRR